MAGVVLANGSMSSNASGEGDIRQSLVEHDLVDCMVALPGALFYSTQIPACLWFLAKNKHTEGFRNRKGEVLFIDARKLGALVNRIQRELSGIDIAQIADTYHAWRGEAEAIERRGAYEDIAGFCFSATLADIKTHGYVLTPGRFVGTFVGTKDEKDDSVPFEEKFSALKKQLEEQFTKNDRLTETIRSALRTLI